MEWNGRGVTRLSGEGRLMDLDPTIGGSLGENEEIQQWRTGETSVESNRSGEEEEAPGPRHRTHLLEQVLEAVHGFPPVPCPRGRDAERGRRGRGAQKYLALALALA
jgi:hypothetical protein